MTVETEKVGYHAIGIVSIEEFAVCFPLCLTEKAVGKLSCGQCDQYSASMVSALS